MVSMASVVSLRDSSSSEILLMHGLPHGILKIKPNPHCNSYEACCIIILKEKITNVVLTNCRNPLVTRTAHKVCILGQKLTQFHHNLLLKVMMYFCFQEQKIELLYLV